MGNATSSALRADDPVTPAPAGSGDGPAFGSLANLGGPRKFKKKPVLVLDPEELEKAHMMFQEASAEMLGEEAPRPERGATLLGLAPMDDEDAEPEDMGESDDADAGDDSEHIPTAEEVLRMTESRAPIDPAMEEAQDEYIAQQLESLDVDHRIFPSLPLKSEEEIAAEEEAEMAAIEARAIGEDALAETRLPDSETELSYEPSEEPTAPVAQAFPVNPLPEPEAEVEELPEAEPAPAPLAQAPTGSAVFGDEPFLDFPTQPLQFAMEEEIAAEPEAIEAEHELEVYEDEPAAEETFEASLPLELEFDDEWEEEEPLPLENEYVEEPENACEPENAYEAESAYEPEAEPDGSYTEVDDEPVDGYAFMYAANPRGRTLHALAEGESNSLRAKLLKEREDAAIEVEEAERSPSVISRFFGWLRGLFG